jgi:hypothetical protein
MNLLPAQAIQELLGVSDGHVVAEGVTGFHPSRNVDIFFQNGHLCRHEWTGHNDGSVTHRDFFFNPGFFRDNIKRMHKDKCNPKLLALFETFGNPLP